jgi:integrase
MSVLAEQLTEYLTVRRALGFKLADTERLLRQYLHYLDQHGERRITIATAVSWAILPSGSDALHYVRLAAVRGFANYLRVVDPTVEIPGVELLPLGPSRRRPFLYTDEEILALIGAAATLRTPHRAATYRTLIGLLASTGIRVGEAIALDRQDFDATLGVLVVRGKRDKVRELPLAPSTATALREYLARSDRPLSAPGERALFVSTPGTRVALDGVEQTFSLLRARAGLQSRGGHRPTLHGLRHVRDPHDARRDP